MKDNVEFYLHFCDNRIDKLHISSSALVLERAAAHVVAVAFWGL